MARGVEENAQELRDGDMWPRAQQASLVHLYQDGTVAGFTWHGDDGRVYEAHVRDIGPWPCEAACIGEGMHVTGCPNRDGPVIGSRRDEVPARKK